MSVVILWYWSQHCHTPTWASLSMKEPESVWFFPISLYREVWKENNTLRSGCCGRCTAQPACCHSHHILHCFSVALHHLLLNKNIFNLKCVHHKYSERNLLLCCLQPWKQQIFRCQLVGSYAWLLVSYILHNIYVYMKWFLGGKQLKCAIPTAWGVSRGLDGQKDPPWPCRTAANRRSSNTSSPVLVTGLLAVL